MIHNLKQYTDHESRSSNTLTAKGVFVHLCDRLQASGRTFGLSLKKRTFVFALAIVPVGSLGSLTVSVPLTYTSLIKEGVVVTTTQQILTPTESVTFVFDEPHESETINIDISPQASIQKKWSTDKKELVLIPIESWTIDTDYAISLTPNKGDVHLPSKIFYFKTIDTPKIINSVPNSGAKNITLFNNRAIKITFDRSVENLDIEARIDNHEDFTQRFDAAYKTLTLTLPEPITKQELLHIQVHGRYKESTSIEMTLLGELSFEIMPPQPESWPEDRESRLQIAAEATKPYLEKGKYIDVNLDARVTTLFEDGEVIMQFINSPGAEETPTPTGIYRIENKALRPISGMFGVFLPYWMAFTEDGKYGFHDLIEWPADHPDFPDSPGGGKESLASIDKAVSPGCVRHTTSNSKIFYEWTEVGTPVKIY